MVRTGLARLLENPKSYLAGQRIGLVVNATAVDPQLRHAALLLHQHTQVNLRRLFGPEHGIYGVAQDMMGVDHLADPETGLPVVSLYGHDEASLSPKPEHLADLDVLVFDIQDIGCRYYTYAATMVLCLQAAKKAGIRLMLLDRPNPLNGLDIEGGGLESSCQSFVGLYPVPQRHGLTMGELARWYNAAFQVNCALEVVACEGWRRDMTFDQTGLPWVIPSPNMPTLDTVFVYPGMCLLEGTNISEGRGTTRPFEIFGAPFIRGALLADKLNGLNLPGVLFRTCWFQPTFHKFANEVCGGLQVQVTDRKVFLPYRTGLAVVWAIKQLWPKQFAWREKVYEFRDDVFAFDLLTGIPAVRDLIDAGVDFEKVYACAISGLDETWQKRSAALLYK